MSEAAPEPGVTDGPGIDSERLPLRESAQGLREDGFSGDFSVVAPGRVRCSACGREHEPEDLAVERTARYEGASNPDDEELILGLTCGGCGQRGVLTVAYGPAASGEEGEVLRRMPDARDRG